MNDPTHGPTFIGIGVQKCATSWLHDVLHAHKDIFTSDPKEIDFFSAYYDRGYEWYERHFSSGMSAQQRGETSPSYFYHPSAPARLKAYNSDLKIIVIFRDPVERAFSNHLHEIRTRHFLSSENFEDGLRNNPCYMEQSRYAKHMSLWYSHFPKEQILPLILEEITTDSEATIRQVYRFLEVDPDGAVDLTRTRSNESVAFHNDKLQLLLQKGGKAIRRNGMGPGLEAVKSFLPIKRLMDLNKRDLRVAAPPLTDEMRELLANELADEMQDLAEMLGRSTLPWKSFPNDMRTHALER